MPRNTAAESPKGAPHYAVQHGVFSVGVGTGGLGGLILVVVVLIGLIALVSACGPPF